MGKKVIYELKNINQVKKYIDTKILKNNDTFFIEEISSGNMNYVYRVKPVNGDSFILKYAANHTRISEDILVSTDRIKIEANALQYLSECVPEYVPEIMFYDEENHCFMMKDYGSFHVLREQLLKLQQVPNLAENISSYLVKSIMFTSELLLSKESNYEINQKFSNPLCDITNTFVFTDPFDALSNTNAIFEPNREFIEIEVFNDNMLKSEILVLKEDFLYTKQALIHGDLHTGSIFTNQSSMIVFDYEFAFYGPIGYDLGNIIANLIFAWLKADSISHEIEYKKWIEQTIKETIDLFLSKFINQWNKKLEEKQYNVNVHTYLDQVIKATASYAGVELIRRVVGIAHVSDLLTIDIEEKRIQAERLAVKIAKQFILDKSKLEHGDDFIKIINKVY